METSATSNDNDNTATFKKFKEDLEETPTNILNFFKYFQADKLKALTRNQWESVFNVIENKINPNAKVLISEIPQLMEWLQPIILESSFGVHCIALIFLFKLVNQLLPNSQNIGPSADQKDIKSLVLLALKILGASKVALLKSFNMKDNQLLEKVILYLSEFSTRRPSFVNILTILEIWKTFSNVFIIYQKKGNLPDNTVIRLLKKPVEFLTREVGLNIDLIHKGQALQQPIEQVEKYLRITNFFIKLLRLFVPRMQNQQFTAAKKFAETYKKAKLLPNHLIGTEIAELLDKYVQKDFDVLMDYVYQHPDILKFLLDFMHNTDDIQKYILLEAYLSSVISQNDGNFIFSSENEFVEIFETFFSDSKVLLDSNSYNAIIVQFAALTMLDDTPNLLMYFRANVLKNNFWIAFASTDVLILLQRYQCKHMIKSSNDVLMKEFYFWRDCCSKFALFSSEIKQVHITRLLNNCLELIKPNTNIQFLKNPHATDFSPEDLRFFLLTGLHKNFGMDVTTLNSELRQLLNQLAAGDGTIKCYYKTIVYIQLLETFHSTFCEQTKSSLTKITEQLLYNDITCRAFSLFINASLKLIVKFRETSPSYDTDKFLKYICAAEKMTMFPGSLKMLHLLSKNPSLQLKQLVNVKLQEYDDINVSGCTIIKLLPEVIKVIDSTKYNHSCLKINPSDEPLKKRQCLG